MRVTRLMLATLRDVPADAEIISHKLLLRGGFIKRVTNGIYAYMPLMWKVLQKITAIVQEEMDAKGGLQTLLPQIHPSDLWKQTGRWKGYTEGEGIMFHLKDRQGREIGLGPTHEEVITSLAGGIINSYKQLPVNLYQIQTKFRDEIRPRFGLMRSREFIMKDAYSFHSSEESLKETYRKMNDAYKNIFFRAGLKTVAVEADSGAIGGAASQEFMVTAEAGEDFILISPDGKYAANQEKAISNFNEARPLEEGELISIDTPNQKSIDDLCLKQGFDKTQIIKVLIMLARFVDNKKFLVLISIRGDQELNETKLINQLNLNSGSEVIELKALTEQKSKEEGIKEIPFGYLGPDLDDSILFNSNSLEKKFIRIADKSASDLKNFICGANKIGLHRVNTKWSQIGGLPESCDLRNAKEGDKCIHDEGQRLIQCRGIEVGHIFQLGRKYSQALKANFTNKSGEEEPFWMGCYGIGISRMAQAAVEQNHDESGIIWPLSIAPFEVVIVIANIKNPVQTSLAEGIYSELIDQGIDALLDDRDERAGVKFKDADLIGIPWRVVVGRDSETGEVEVIERSNKSTQKVNANLAKKQIPEQIKNQRGLFVPFPL